MQIFQAAQVASMIAPNIQLASWWTILSHVSSATALPPILYIWTSCPPRRSIVIQKQLFFQIARKDFE